MTDHAKAIDSAFAQHGVDARVAGQTTGPSIVRYEVALGRGVKVKQIISLRDEIAYQTAVDSVRIQLIPGKSAVGIELPRDTRETVAWADMPSCDGLKIALGKDIEGKAVIADLAELPHLLVAGTTGSGKSTMINAMLVSLLGNSPEDVQMVLVDPKMVELQQYNGVAHLRQPVITEIDDAVIAMKQLVDEMEFRFQRMALAGQRNINGLGFPRVVVVIDELADLVLQAKIIEKPIIRLAQKARAAGIHLVLATQKPMASVISSLLKSNCPSRLSFAVASAVDSRVILDERGAEELLGHGDALFKPIGGREAIRIQGALVTDEEIAEAVKRATVEDAPTEVFAPVSVDARRVETARNWTTDPLDSLITKTQRAADHAGRYIQWVPSMDAKAASAGKTLWESEAIMRLMQELEEARQALTEVNDQLVAMQGMEKVA